MTLTIRGALIQARSALAHGDIMEAPLEADLLLGLALDMPRSKVYASMDEAIPDAARHILDALVQRRLHREPLAYILGKREFFGLEFQVCPDVLIPRPESETLVEQVILMSKAHPQGSELLLADIGTGSGALAVSLAKALPRAHFYATDISETALNVARENATTHGVQDRIIFLQGDLMELLPKPVDMVVANLPYVSSHAIPRLQPEVSRFEPREALDGGPDGLCLLRRLVQQGPHYLRPGGAILLEMDPEQMEAASGLARQVFPEATLRRVNDLSGRERVLVVQAHVNAPTSKGRISVSQG